VIRKFVLRPEARREFDQAFDRYCQIEQKLAFDFAGSVQESFDRIAENPEAFQVVFRNVRRAVLRRFPYSILYRIQKDRLEVIAVFHSRRMPEEWQKRI